MTVIIKKNCCKKRVDLFTMLNLCIEEKKNCEQICARANESNFMDEDPYNKAHNSLIVTKFEIRFLWDILYYYVHKGKKLNELFDTWSSSKWYSKKTTKSSLRAFDP